MSSTPKGKLSSRYIDTSDDNDFNYTPSPTKKTKQARASQELESLYHDTITVDDDGDYDTTGIHSRQAAKRVNRRAGKTFDKLKLSPADYEFTRIPPRSSDSIIAELGEYSKSFMDILIDGNLRFKFIPKCSTRAGAEAYINSKFDDRGYPKYRLIRPNARDPFGHDICDLNGDGVDDVIICNRQGLPVIVNGYKLVRADPYKRIWKNEFAAGSTNLEFNEWLDSKFNINKNYVNLTPEDWERGRIDWDVSKATEQGKAAYEHFVNVGLGKPRLNTKLNARALWGSLFAKYIWQNALYSFETNNKEYSNLAKLVNYLKVANAVYTIAVEWKIAQETGNTDWIQWIRYKDTNKRDTKARIGKIVQEIYIQLDDEVSKGTEGKQGSMHIKLSSIVSRIIKRALLIETNSDRAKQLNATIGSGDLTSNEMNVLKNRFKEEVDRYVASGIKGYMAYLSTKPKKADDFDTYTAMTLNQ